MAEENKNLMENIVGLCKRRGFLYSGSEIYGGLAGMWDYGPHGLALKNNIKTLWWKQFVEDREDMYGLDAAILMNEKVWQASGHARGFADMLVDCLKCKKRFRADHLENTDKCPSCGGELGQARQFYMMLETHIGATEDASTVSYLRPETAQGIFVNFKNIVDSFSPKLPFGIGQIGKAFRNEIAPRDFLFRVRELEQMEVEYFVRPKDWEKYFEIWRQEIVRFLDVLGLPKNRITEVNIAPDDRAHYSNKTIDFEFEFPFGQKELLGLAYRTDYDLKNHNLSFLDTESGDKIIPHVIEPSLGLERLVLAVLVSSYTEDEMNGEKRVVLKLPVVLAPVRVAVFPLLKNKPELVEKAREVFVALKEKFGNVLYDDNGNIGKRYRRQDEIGTPVCITIDFDTLKDDMVTFRDRDSGKQERIKITEIAGQLEN